MLLFFLSDSGNRQDADNQLRTAGYEVINSFVTNSANDSLPAVAALSDVIIQRVEQSVSMQQQVVSVEDRITLEEMQNSLTSVLLVSTRLLLHLQIERNNRVTDLHVGYRSTAGDRDQAAGRPHYAGTSSGLVHCSS